MAKTNVPKLTNYSEFYKEQCFQVWWAAGRPTLVKRLNEILPIDEFDRVVDLVTFKRWRDEYGWDMRGDVLDARAIVKAEDDLVNTRVLMLKEQAAKARILQSRGMDFIEENGFDSSASAVQAIIRGAQLERESRGLSTALLRLAEMTTEELSSETQKLLQRLSESGEVIDLAVIEEDIEREEDAEIED